MRPSSCLFYFLHSSLLRRPAPVVRDRSGVLDIANLQAGGRERAHSRFPARTRTANAHFHGSQAAFHGLVGCRQRGLLRGEWRTLARPAKKERAGARPGNRVALLVCDGHDGVVEGRLDVHDSSMDDALLFLLEAFLLRRFIGRFSLRSFCHKFMSWTPLSSCWQWCRGAGLCACARWYE